LAGGDGGGGCEEFEGEKAQGNTVYPDSCIIAQYLAIWYDDVCVGTEEFSIGPRGASYDLPFVIEAVRQNFDFERYPDLIAD
jgi:hypothetical protein